MLLGVVVVSTVVVVTVEVVLAVPGVVTGGLVGAEVGWEGWEGWEGSGVEGVEGVVKIGPWNI